MIQQLCADRILANGKIITVDAADTVVEAVAIKDGRFFATGSTDEIMTLKGKITDVVDLEGKTALPGIIDSHTHPSYMATRRLEIDCRLPHVKSISDIMAMIEKRAREIEPGKWIIGANFNDSKLVENRHITCRELNGVAPDAPVYIVSDTGHQALANSAAFKLAGVTADSLDPPGGTIDRDENGKLTGLLYETAKDLVSRVVPPYTVNEIKDAFKGVLDQFSEWGVTSTHDASAYNSAIRAYQQLLSEGVKKVRLNLMVSVEPRYPEGANLLDAMADFGIESNFGNDWLKVMTLKIMGDGSGAGGTAAVYEPQHRGTGGLGLMMTAPKLIESFVLKAHAAGLRCSIHSIGDRGIDIALDCIEKAQKMKPVNDMRHRIEHNSCSTPKQLERIKALGVVPSSSIGYMYGIGEQYYENFGPERSRWLHPHQTMKQMGIIAGGNNDCPVTFYSPFVQMYAAMTRKTITGRVIAPQEAIGIMDAIRVYTYNGAYLGKDEDKLGSIEPGKLADLVVIDRDILTAAPEALLETRVLMTIVDGKTIYEK